MNDQQLAMLLAPVVVIVPPAIGCYWGMRRSCRGQAAFTAWMVSTVAGLALGAAWAAAVDLRAAAMPGGNPWIVHVRGVTLVDLVFGSGLGGVIGALTGAISGLVVWVRKKAEPSD